jgi:hypothetical protein
VEFAAYDNGTDLVAFKKRLTALEEKAAKERVVYTELNFRRWRLATVKLSPFQDTLKGTSLGARDVL